jgi:hypothetical protein
MPVENQPTPDMKTKSTNTKKRPKAGQRRALGLASGSPPKGIAFNINGYIRVKLTKHGKKIHRDRHDELNALYPKCKLKYRKPTEDAEGWSEWQAWHLMQTFGPHIGMGLDQPFDTNVQIMANG